MMYNTALAELPTNKDELEKCLADPHWRIFSGCLYKIKIKGDDFKDEFGNTVEADTYELPFKPNAAQVKFLNRLWHRNIILKARQLGFTTLICILWLDHALFNANQNCGIIAQDLPTVYNIFKDKIKFAYDNLPDEIKARFPLETCNKSEIQFAHNGSSIRVSTSFRSGTLHRLHISEFGKICATDPAKDDEVITGSIPTVPTTGILVIESTAEGRNGSFYSMVQAAQTNFFLRKILTFKDYRFHFYAWWQEPKYRLDASTVEISSADHEYFDEVEAIVQQKMGIKARIDPDQRAWYVATRDNDLKGDHAKMWQEYPSFPDEAFQVAKDGNYYAKDMLALRKRGGITQVEVLDIPTCTFWDIGVHDGCAIWYHQSMNGQDRFIRYYEKHGQDLRHYVAEIKSHGYIYHTHYLPHDAAHKRLGDFNKSVLEQLEDLLPGHNFVIVPRITELIQGIQSTRKHLKSAFFDKDNCKLGIERIEGYQKKFSKTDKCFIDQPNKANGCSEGADALRQWAQAKDAGLIEEAYASRVGFAENSAVSEDRYIDEPPDWRL
ncbi:terminase [Acinetobacter thermotolerans]|uniref:terminase n=1 Tax=Acinetobacter thermotolerans TaxID=3151487 RepID=UPI00325B3BCB